MKKGSVAICFYVLFASVAIVIIALGSWVYDCFKKSDKKFEV